jgi:uncharacterized protein YdhG (YjbR/CyaY superfamily)
MPPRAASANIDEYIGRFSSEVQSILQKVRATIQKAAPKAEEKISYGIPAFTLDGRILIYFAGFKNHIGIYPPIRGDQKLIKTLERYRGEKGNLKFPFDEPIPYPLISKVTRHRAKELKAAATPKRTKR